MKVLAGVLFFIVSIHSHALDSLRMEKRKGKTYVIHQVEKGETLYSLSRRYTSEIEDIIKENEIVDNQLYLGQELRVLLKKKATLAPPDAKKGSTVYHTVKTKETLFSLSRQYGVTIDQIKEWNQLLSDEISIDQQLIVSTDGAREESNVSVIEMVDESQEEKEVISSLKEPVKDPNKLVGFITYYVQNGDLIESIARKFNVRPDSIVIWNNLTNTYLSIGQKLLIRGKLDMKAIAEPKDVKVLPYGTIRKQTDASGFTKVFEEGIASKIDSSVETEKYLALHRTLPIGTLIEVRNLMNNQKVFVRVIGNLPETGLNKKILVRLTPICFDRLGVIDPKTRVEVSYYQN